MNAQHMTLLSVWMLAPLVNGVTLGQTASAPRTLARVLAVPAPTITILSASTGALVRSEGAGNAALDLGRVSYFNGSSAPGESSKKNSGSFVISTRFILKVDCPGASSFSRVNVTMSRMDGAASHGLAIDGIKLGSAAQILAGSMPCGSFGEHQLDVEIPVSTPAGSIGSTVAFEAALRK
jgi:hypothetical protein